MAEIYKWNDCNSDVPEKVISVWANRRSGHHAVVEWLQACLQRKGFDPCVHVNDVESNLPLDHPNRTLWKPGQVLRRALGHKALIVNYEDRPIEQRIYSSMYTGLYELTRGSDHMSAIVIRDWYTLAASRTAKFMAQLAKGNQEAEAVFGLDHALPVWKGQARIALAQCSPASPAIIKYNDWVSGVSAREAIASRLELPNSEDSIMNVPRFGGGSSIDGLVYDGSATEMTVLTRWRNLSFNDREYYKKYTNDGEIDELNRELFGFGRSEVQEDMARY